MSDVVSVPLLRPGSVNDGIVPADGAGGHRHRSRAAPGALAVVVLVDTEESLGGTRDLAVDALADHAASGIATFGRARSRFGRGSRRLSGESRGSSFGELTGTLAALTTLALGGALGVFSLIASGRARAGTGTGTGTGAAGRSAGDVGAAGTAAAAAGRSLEGIVGGVVLGNVFAGVWEISVEHFGGLAPIVNVGSEHWREVVHLAASTGYRDRGTVHVHFPVANIVEPSPSQNSIAVLNLRRHDEGEVLVDTLCVTPSAFFGFGFKIEFGVGWAATNVAVNDLPVVRILLLLGIGFVGESNLARASTMDGGISATTQIEVQRLGGSSSH